VLEFRSQALGKGINPQGIRRIKKLSEKCAFFSHHRTYKAKPKARVLGVMSLTFWVIPIGDKENVSGLIQYFNLH
jgi:hypothetical protein